MSFQDKIKMFNPKKIPSNQNQTDKNTTPVNKEKEIPMPTNDESKTTKKENETKKDNKEKDKKTYNRQNTGISTSIHEKMKSLELYFKLRNDGFSKSYTEAPKSFDKNDYTYSLNAQNKVAEKKVIKELDKEKETMIKLEIEQDANEFNENNYKERRYDKNNVETGKKFFKLRYIKNKLNSEKKQKENNDKADNEEHDKERILRKYNSDFILTLEKSIISFNVKNYKESYEFLESSGIIKNIGEYGEILLVVSGFDKFLIGEFLAKQKYPNDKKEVLNNFIESIDMNKSKIKFIDCLRFLFSKLILPKDANLILEIMDKFSINYFDVNKKDTNFVDTFKSSDNVYLLVSTILALNTMFTRKDIKIKNVIKKDEFIKMNAGISKDFIEKLYDELKKNPIIMSDDYNESMYKKLAPLVKEDEGSKLGYKNTKSGQITEENRNSNPNAGTDDKLEEVNSSSSLNKINERISKDNNAIDEQIIEEDEINDEFYDDNAKKGLEKKEFSLTNNLKNFTEEDEKYLKTPQKLYKITGSNKSAIREYVLNEDKTKLYYDKKQKKFLIIKNIIAVYNGINHSHNSNIKKYIKNNPSEEQFSGNFISLIFKNDKDQIDLMSDDLESALKWFKAIKSLVLIQGNKSDHNIKLYESTIKKKIEDIWTIILNKWNIYGKYLIMKSTERNKFIHKDEKQNIHFLNNNRLPNKEIFSFLKNIYNKKLSKDKELDYNEFSTLYYLGLPDLIRNKIWKILIGNPCCILMNSYGIIKKQIPNINFKEIDLSNTNKNYCQDHLSNKIINEIIKTKDLFINKEEQEENFYIEMINQIYNIARSFYIFRPDIPYNKSIISIIFLLLTIFKDESNTFINTVNLICSNEFKIFIGDQNEIKNYSSFFNILLKKYLDKIEKHFTKLEITPELYITPWFEELFTRTLNVKLSCHVLDLFLINGEVVLFETSLAIIKTLEEELLNLTINEVFKALERFSENISEIEFITNLKKFSIIKKEYFDWKLEDEIAKQKSGLFEIIFSSQE